jgi:hypothetical protein
MAEDIVIRTIKIAVVATMAAVFTVAVRSQAVFIAAVRMQEVVPGAEAPMSPTAVADAVDNK